MLKSSTMILTDIRRVVNEGAPISEWIPSTVRVFDRRARRGITHDELEINMPVRCRNV